MFQGLEFVLTLALVGGVFIMSQSRIALVAMLVSLMLAVIAAVFRIRAPSIVDIFLVAGAWLLMGVTLVWVVAQAVFAPGRVTHHRVMGAILLYLVIAIIFVALFSFVELMVPRAFSGLSAQDSPAFASNTIYFSIVTLTSTGYGDVFPVHPIARSLCNVETIIGQLYPATLLARLVTLEMSDRG